MTGLGERELFRAALRTTMIKRASELPVFEELFDVYFTGLGRLSRAPARRCRTRSRCRMKEFQKFLDQMEKMLKEHGDELSELAKQLLQNNDGQLERMMREAARAVRMQGIQRTIEENYFARALARALGFDKLEQEIKELREQLSKLGPRLGLAREDGGVPRSAAQDARRHHPQVRAAGAREARHASRAKKRG